MALTAARAKKKVNYRDHGDDEDVPIRLEENIKELDSMAEQLAGENDAQEAPSPPSDEQTNRDEENCYAAVPWSELIMPVDFMDRRRFAVAFSGTVRNAWVKQTAPACAAASVASALNHILKLERTSEDAFSQEGVIELYKQLVNDKINFTLARLGRVAEGDVGALKVFISEHIKDLTSGTSKKKVAEVKEALRGLPKEDKLRCFIEVPSQGERCEEESRKLENDDDPAPAPASSANSKEAKRTLSELIRQMRGLAKLSLARPSTGHIGETFMGKERRNTTSKPKMERTLYAGNGKSYGLLMLILTLR